MAAKGTVRVYVGSRKGAYVVSSDTARKKWKVAGPFEHGKDVFHVAPDPRSPGTVYAAMNSFFWGPMVYRSTDHGKKWTEVAPPMGVLSSKRPQPETFENAAKRPITNVWHVEPGPESEPNTIYLGVDPGMLFRSDDRGDSWEGVEGINEHETRSKWNPGAGGLCTHTVLIDPKRPNRRYVGISAAGTFRSDDGGAHYRPANQGVKVSFQPEKYPAFGQCVHKVAFDPADPNTLYRQDHDGIYVSHDGMESWKHVGGALESDFGFVVATAQAMPGHAFFAPLLGEPRTAVGELQVYDWSEKDKKFRPTIKGRPFPGEMGTHREGMACDALDPAGVYLGTTTGELLFSNDGAKSWGQVPYHFPPIHSVSVASPPE